MKRGFLSPDWNFVESSMLGHEDKEGGLVQRQFDNAGAEKIMCALFNTICCLIFWVSYSVPYYKSQKKKVTISTDTYM